MGGTNKSGPERLWVEFQQLQQEIKDFAAYDIQKLMSLFQNDNYVITNADIITWIKDASDKADKLRDYASRLKKLRDNGIHHFEECVRRS